MNILVFFYMYVYILYIIQFLKAACGFIFWRPCLSLYCLGGISEFSPFIFSLFFWALLHFLNVNWYFSDQSTMERGRKGEHFCRAFMKNFFRRLSPHLRCNVGSPLGVAVFPWHAHQNKPAPCTYDHCNEVAVVTPVALLCSRYRDEIIRSEVRGLQTGCNIGEGFGLISGSLAPACAVLGEKPPQAYGRPLSRHG